MDEAWGESVTYRNPGSISTSIAKGLVLRVLGADAKTSFAVRHSSPAAQGPNLDEADNGIEEILPRAVTLYISSHAGCKKVDVEDGPVLTPDRHKKGIRVWPPSVAAVVVVVTSIVILSITARRPVVGGGAEARAA